MASEKYNQTYQTRSYDTVNEIQHPQKGFEDKFQPRIYYVARGNYQHIDLKLEAPYKASKAQDRCQQNSGHV
jgi:hypothetical protein